MYGLLYPAVLGAIFYDLLPTLTALSPESLRLPHLWKIVLAGLLVVHFSIDYLLVRAEPDPRALVFIIDLIIVVLLFGAFDALKVDEYASIQVRQAAYCLAGAYICFLIWKALVRPAGVEAWIFDVCSLLWFLSVAIFFPKDWLLVVFLSLSCIWLFKLSRKSF
jgi:hypothetical protein